MKSKLKITPAQEDAWTRLTAGMQPPARMSQRPTPEQRVELDKLCADGGNPDPTSTHGKNLEEAKAL